ncbi:integral membrane protein [Mycolicibacterium phlei]|uniref:Membrane protein n=2 Tax=Mycolicibacterium phlei TaxID=1771 RepID=A0A5N5V5N4_MYCPH|nr:DUF3043 domain-containing protein [Mycolicibacterium phlei]VEG10246.1 integral membrane protein [Mycobacteroides chelonae]AMO62141.1 hypothetical protein MPHLCCUG_03337 [Mycolicibacterium phlei]EID14299.1 hypothetical protein MPHLEI_12044 [Mycolicibacterium phlei RIVM601174]KAB7757048.1 membrane protein [Mycolicibacterium phlei DSM 43239 = CCUG 21000]KXW62548.1 membrane protein [Mycolicibacterium phlei DSM 43070]
MNLLGRKKDNPPNPDTADTSGASEAASGDSSGSQDSRKRGTAPKGRPTPKRNEAARRRGPVAPAPMTAAEARRRRKEMRKTLTREERKAEKAARRAEMAERRERMMNGEEEYLLPRDRGPVRRFVRDVVDARRNALGLFMPAAMFLIFVMLAMPSLAVQQAVSYAMFALVLIMVADGFILGRKVNRLVAEKFPDSTEGGWKLGFYAASRASQLRRMRAPRPRVNRGDKVA